MADLLVNDYFNLSSGQVSDFNAPRYFYKNQSPKKGSQSGTVFVDNNANFTANMVGGLLDLAANADGKLYSYNPIILQVQDAHTLIVDVSQTVTSTDYTIWYGGVQFDQNGYLSTDNLYINNIINNGSTLSKIITQDITINATALASAASVVLFPAINSATSYKVRDIVVNYKAVGFGGIGGDRLLSITDGTNVYNSTGITAALLQTQVNTVWGGTGNPLPGTVAISTPTVAGSNLVAKYIGGTTDYTVGTLLLTVTVERIA